MQEPLSSHSLDNAYQRLFDVCFDIVTAYNKCSATDIGGGVEGMNAKTVENELTAYKEKYDQTTPDIHVDVACELYDNVKSSVNRGYLCNSWLKNEKSCFYYGASYDDCNDCIVRLDKMFAMLEYMKRSTEQFVDQALILRHRFFCNLYAVFIETQKRNKDATPSNLETLESRYKEILDDIPKPTRKPVPEQGGLASLFGGGKMEDMMSNLKNALPKVVEMVTQGMESNGYQMDPEEKGQLSSCVENLTSFMDNPASIQDIARDIQSGNADISTIVQRIMPKGPGAMAPSGRAPKPPPPSIE